MKIAILSDIHAVADAFRAGLAQAEAEGFDELIILGDLLTYGVQPLETLDVAREAVHRHAAKLVIGNHDEMYLEAQSGGPAYATRLPDWIRESYEWTIARAGNSTFWDDADWVDEVRFGDMLIAHANPFGARNWTYLNSPERLQEACETLHDRQCKAGVFGHVHRFRVKEDEIHGVWAATVGSIGQPREPGGGSLWAVATLSDTQYTIEARAVPFDWGQARDAVAATSLSDATKERIVSYYQ